MFNVADNDRYNAQMNFNKYSFRSNIDIDITKSTQLGLSLSTQYTTKNAPCTTTNDLYAYTMYVTPWLRRPYFRTACWQSRRSRARSTPTTC